MRKTRLLVARQAGTLWHKNQQIVGQKNAELSMEGLARAENLAKQLAEEKIDVIFASRLGRAIDTAKVVAKYHRLRVIPVQDLDERGLGILEGKTKKELSKELKELLNKEVAPEDGESAYDFEKRVIGFLENNLAENEGKTILYVSHKGPVVVIQDYFTRFDETKNDDDKDASMGGLSEFEIDSLEPCQVAVKRLDDVNYL